MIRLRELRKWKNINQQKLAMELNITQAAISKYELGLSEPDIAMINNIADYFHVSADYLIGRSDTPAVSGEINLTQEETMLLNKIRCLDKHDRELLTAYLNGLLKEEM